MWLFDLLVVVFLNFASPRASIPEKPEHKLEMDLKENKKNKNNNNKFHVLDPSDPQLFLIKTGPTIAPFKESRFYCSAADDA